MGGGGGCLNNNSSSQKQKAPAQMAHQGLGGSAPPPPPSTYGLTNCRLMLRNAIMLMRNPHPQGGTVYINHQCDGLHVFLTPPGANPGATIFALCLDLHCPAAVSGSHRSSGIHSLSRHGNDAGSLNVCGVPGGQCQSRPPQGGEFYQVQHRQFVIRLWGLPALAGWTIPLLLLSSSSGCHKALFYPDNSTLDRIWI